MGGGDIRDDQVAGSTEMISRNNRGVCDPAPQGGNEFGSSRNGAAERPGYPAPICRHGGVVLVDVDDGADSQKSSNQSPCYIEFRVGQQDCGWPSFAEVTPRRPGRQHHPAPWAPWRFGNQCGADSSATESIEMAVEARIVGVVGGCENEALDLAHGAFRIGRAERNPSPHAMCMIASAGAVSRSAPSCRRIANQTAAPRRVAA